MVYPLRVGKFGLPMWNVKKCAMPPVALVLLIQPLLLGSILHIYFIWGSADTCQSEISKCQKKFAELWLWSSNDDDSFFCWM